MSYAKRGGVWWCVLLPGAGMSSDGGNECVERWENAEE